MASTENSGLGHGTNGFPQTDIEESIYPLQQATNESNNSPPTPKYQPSPKHTPDHGWGSDNPIKTQVEGQKLLDTGIHEGRQIYNVTSDGKIVKFQPDNTPGNGYHSYEVSKPRDIPNSVLKQMLENGLISRSEYNKLRKGKK